MLADSFQIGLRVYVAMPVQSDIAGLRDVSYLRDYLEWLAYFFLAGLNCDCAVARVMLPLECSLRLSVVRANWQASAAHATFYA